MSPMSPTRDDQELSFDERLRQWLGEDDAQRLASHDEIPPFVRVNTLCTDRETLRAELERGYGIVTEPHPALEVALRVVSAPHCTPTGTLHHFLGHFVQQSLGSMLPPLLLDPRPGERVLDLCASPGSKTTQLAAMMGGRGELWANDVNGMRMSALAARVDASRASHVITTRHGGERLPNLCGATFDRVLADVPCTGLGRREHVGIGRERYGYDGPSNLPGMQYQLLLAACKLVRAGGRIVYSTCSLMPDENEAVVHRIVSRLPVRLVEPPQLAGLVLREGRTRLGHEAFHPSLVHARTLTPWENPSPGFFVAVLEKTDELDPARHARRGAQAASAAELPTLDCEHPEVAPIIDNLVRNYGMERAVFAPYRYVPGREAINIVAGEIETVWSGAFRVGTTLARRRGALWRLSHSALQRFGAAVTRNVVTLPAPLAEALARTGHAESEADPPPPTPYPALAIDPFGPIASIHYDAATHHWRWKRAQALALPARSHAPR